MRTKLHIKITYHDDANLNVLIHRKHGKTKTTSFLKETVENADLHKAVLNKTMTDHTRILRIIRFRSSFNLLNN